MGQKPYLFRDSKGWRLPKEGTLSHQIYLLLRTGKTQIQISRQLNKDSNLVGVLIWKIKHPAKANSVGNDWYGPYGKRAQLQKARTVR